MDEPINVDVTCLLCGKEFVTSEEAVAEIDAKCPDCGSTAVTRRENVDG